MKRTVITLIFLLSHCCLAVTPWDASAISKAVAQGAWENSENLLRDLKTKDVPVEQQSMIDYNLGVSLYSQEKFEESLPFFEAAAKAEDNDELRAKALYNQGNSLFRLKRLEEAKTAYQDALLTNPDDDDSRYNLEVLQEEEKKQDEEDKKDQSDKNEDEEDQDKKEESDKNKNEQEEKDSDKDKNQNNKDENDQKNQDQENQDQKEQQGDQKDPKNQEPEMTEAEKKAAQEEAERARLLDYFKQQEKDGRPATAVQPQAAPVRGKTW